MLLLTELLILSTQPDTAAEISFRTFVFPCDKAVHVFSEENCNKR